MLFCLQCYRRGSDKASVDHVSFQYVYSPMHPSHGKMLLTLVEVGK